MPRFSRTSSAFVAILVIALGPAVIARAQTATAKPGNPTALAPSRFAVEAGDGTGIATWVYPIEEDATPLGIVILLHDLGGGHTSVEKLARSLQASGCVVVAPDLRGHGESSIATLPAGDEDQAKFLKKNDFEMMAASRGGQVRDQSGVRGDVEAVRNLIRQRIAQGLMPDAPLFLVGSGLGATVAAHWAAEDSRWPDLASGPQGREVTALALISPTFSARGFSIAPALATPALRQAMPILIVAGTGDRDGIRLFDQMKRQRPKEWFDTRHPRGDAKDASPRGITEASLIMIAHPSAAEGDALATARSADQRSRGYDPASVIPAFLRAVSAQTR